MAGALALNAPPWKPGDPGGPAEKPARYWEGWNPDTYGWAPNSTVGRLLAAVQVGATTTAAAAVAGISRSTWYAWVRQAQEVGTAPDGGLLDPEDVPERHAPLVALLHRLHEAEARLEVRLLSVWTQAAADDWRAAERLLSKRFPAQWGDKATVEVESGPGGSAADALWSEMLAVLNAAEADAADGV